MDLPQRLVLELLILHPLLSSSVTEVGEIPLNSSVVALKGLFCVPKSGWVRPKGCHICSYTRTHSYWGPSGLRTQGGQDLSGRLSVPGQALFHQDSSLHHGLSHTWEKKITVNGPFLTSKGQGDIPSGGESVVWLSPQGFAF